MEAALLQPVDQDEPNVIKVRFNNKLITFCFNSRAQEASMEDFALLLSVVENEVIDATNEHR
jgi:hypothetical protein